MSWDDLVASALVGTARRPPVLPSSLGWAVDPSDPEGAVLTAGGVLGLYRQAGFRPPVDKGPALPVSPPEQLHYCSEAAAFRLDRILAGDYRAVLGEWLGLAAAANRLVPPDRLPELLDVVTTDASLRPAATDVMGERGRWLGRLNPTWAWVTGAEDDAGVWATGSTVARQLFLHRLRATDPGAARELLGSTWATETPDDRAAFVGVLRTGLSMDDEPFLEAALDDRRKEVRRAAANLLARLPDSRLAARMAERARPLVAASRLPTEVDASMARDGIEARPPDGMGARAWWLFQMVSGAPLRTWSLGMVERADPLLREAWARAAVRQGNAEWAEALLAYDDIKEPGLLRALPPDKARAVATERVVRQGFTLPVLAALDDVPEPWGPELSAAVVERLGEVVGDNQRDTAVRHRAGEFGLRLDPSVDTAPLAEHAPAWSDMVGWVVDLLTFRAEMREELW